MASPAVVVQSAYKFYGVATDPNKKVVLDQLDMRVERGSIYGLLGASGCGKTTLLSCIVGRRRLNGGDVWVLGGRPGERGSGVPGHRIGYMPQDIALVPEFKVKDAVFYFGRIYGMSQSLMEERLDFLSDLLELPPHERLLKNLSGGQQRRVSLAVALVHQPELLILDEPTVGLDPVLREKIWNFLVDLVKDGTSVIITTHYIDETKQADKIGLMRGGKLLAEESPSEMIRRYDVQTLEEAFLILSIKQSNAHKQQIREEASSSKDASGKSKSTGISNSGFSDSNDNLFKRAISSTDPCVFSETDIQDSKYQHPAAQRAGASSTTRYKAILIKNIQQLGRHPGGLIFSAIFPIIQILAFFMAVGHDPRSVDIGIVNKEVANHPYGLNICSNASLPYVLMDNEECQFNMISCKFENLIKSTTPLKLVRYDMLESALEATRRGQTYGTVFIPSNFSSGLRQRLIEPLDADLGNGSIAIRLDMTNHQISHFVKKTFYDVYNEFSISLMRACGMSERAISTPVAFHDPIYGQTNPKYSNFMAPGMMMTILFFLATLVTSTLMITDRLEGVWDRNIVAGVKPKEILFVHIVIQSLVIAVQTVELLLISFAAYDIPYKGDLATIASLLFLQGLCGMCYGFLISVCCSTYAQAFYISTGSFYPMIFLCGLMWPLEGMSKGLRMIAMVLPFTVPSLSLRDIIEKGFSIVRHEVYIGFAVTVTWIIATVILCILVLKYRKN